MVSVFDEHLDAKTFIYLRGDERSFPEGKPSVEPAMPAFLQGDSLKVQRIELPAAARYPGLKSFLQTAETKKREQALSATEEALATARRALLEARHQLAVVEETNAFAGHAKAFGDLLVAEASLCQKSNHLSVAQADLEAIRARIAADEARFSSSRSRRHGALGSEAEAQHALPEIDRDRLTSEATNHRAAAASRAERLLALRQAEAKFSEAESTLALLQTERVVGAARRVAAGAAEKSEEPAKVEAALKKAQEEIVATRKALETAQAALETNSMTYTPLSPIYPEQSTGRRRALATWMTSRENPLTARVAVNHMWARHFHAPLVTSVFDFGRNGVPPTHPELLDWLAVELMEHGWSMKHLHRLIVSSSTYRQTSSLKWVQPPMTISEAERSDGNTRSTDSTLQPFPGRSSAISDTDNRFLWRMNTGQMEAEVLRDSLLFLAEELDLAPVGYPLPNAEAEKSRHRSLYFECFPEPNGQSQFAEMFDPPNPTECYRRSQTIVPQQALALTNSKLSKDDSRVLAQRLVQRLAPEKTTNEAAFVTAAYEHILTRGPTQEEVAACCEFLAKQSKGGRPDAARASLVHALFNHNDFVTIR
jgi:hypothetical protein